MCGIAGIINKTNSKLNLPYTIAAMSLSIAHRGPDGEGFLLVNPQGPKSYLGRAGSVKDGQALPWIPSAPLPDSAEQVRLALAHRRLSIIDLTAGGHQPMSDAVQKNWITFNGEIYNYIELRKELSLLGHSFLTQSDTEVILAAYRQWGSGCVSRFNGMWSFVIYDAGRQLCFASRDRLGVKPFYYINQPECFAFASEQKAFVRSGLIRASGSDASLSAYLVYGALERESDNFFEGVTELMPGHNLYYGLQDDVLKTEKFYSLQDSFTQTNEHLDNAALIARISGDFRESVKLRMRSDVEVGTCLSGGIDSSALAVTMAELGSKQLHCFTSVFSREKNNEDKYASIVAGRIGARHHKTEPEHEAFMQDADDLIYSQDVPIWSTSTYAQHKVMQLASRNGIKVVLDGQGADELFAGYHHHLVAQWNHYLLHGRIIELTKEMKAAGRTMANPYSFFLKEKVKSNYDVSAKRVELFLKEDFISAARHKDRQHYYNSVNEQLADDILNTRLKIFLKCEDRAGMWHGVESRTPFSDDINLINTAFSFRGERKIQQGTLKYLLREAVRPQLPEEIYTRYDKTGFETPMNAWIQALKYRMLQEVEAANLHFLKPGALSAVDFNNAHHVAFFFKLFVLARWKKVFQN